MFFFPCHPCRDISLVGGSEATWGSECGQSSASEMWGFCSGCLWMFCVWVSRWHWGLGGALQRWICQPHELGLSGFFVCLFVTRCLCLVFIVTSPRLHLVTSSLTCCKNSPISKSRCIFNDNLQRCADVSHRRLRREELSRLWQRRGK